MIKETRRLLERAQQGDRQAQQMLVEQNQGLVWSMVRRFLGRGAEEEDLFQLGCIGLIKAIQGFDLEYGTEFSTYAVPKITGEIRRFLRDDGLIKVGRSTKEMASKIMRCREELTHTLGREPTVGEVAGKSGLCAEEIAACEIALTPARSLQKGCGEKEECALEELVGDEGMEEQVVEQVMLRDAIVRLPERERQVIALRYLRGMTQQRVARVLGVSQVQISRLERRAIDRIRQWIA